MSSDVLAELSYEAALRGLDLQERAIEQLRNRTGTLLAASSLIASFLGGMAIRQANGLGAPGVLALVSLACSIGLCVYVLLPRSGFVFCLRASAMYDGLFEHKDDDEALRRRLAYWLEEFWVVNQDMIDSLDRCYTGAAIALVLQLLLWSSALLGIISR